MDMPRMLEFQVSAIFPARSSKAPVTPQAPFDSRLLGCVMLIKVFGELTFCSRATALHMESPAGGRPRGSDGFYAVVSMG
jgi:hypothetical protein